MSIFSELHSILKGEDEDEDEDEDDDEGGGRNRREMWIRKRRYWDQALIFSYNERITNGFFYVTINSL